MVIKIVSVFFTSMLELWVAVPMGFALKLDPFVNFVASAAGAIAGVAVVIASGEGLRAWLIRVRQGKKSDDPGEKKPSAIEKAWNKYGVIGLGLLAPWVTGAPLGAAIGAGLGAGPKKLFFWISAGSIICTAILVIMCAAGMSLVNHK